MHDHKPIHTLIAKGENLSRTLHSTALEEQEKMK